MRNKKVLMMIIGLGLLASTVSAQDAERGQRRGPPRLQLTTAQQQQLSNASTEQERRELMRKFRDEEPAKKLPAEVTERLSAQQLSEVSAAKTMGEQRKLLESYGIEMRPPRGPHGPGGDRRGPPPEDRHESRSEGGSAI